MQQQNRVGIIDEAGENLIVGLALSGLVFRAAAYSDSACRGYMHVNPKKAPLAVFIKDASVKVIMISNTLMVPATMYTALFYHLPG